MLYSTFWNRYKTFVFTCFCETNENSIIYITFERPSDGIQCVGPHLGVKPTNYIRNSSFSNMNSHQTSLFTYFSTRRRHRYKTLVFIRFGALRFIHSKNTILVDPPTRTTFSFLFDLLCISRPVSFVQPTESLDVSQSVSQSVVDGLRIKPGFVGN